MSAWWTATVSFTTAGSGRLGMACKHVSMTTADQHGVTCPQSKLPHHEPFWLDMCHISQSLLQGIFPSSMRSQE